MLLCIVRSGSKHSSHHEAGHLTYYQKPANIRQLPTTHVLNNSSRHFHALPGHLFIQSLIYLKLINKNSISNE